MRNRITSSNRRSVRSSNRRTVRRSNRRSVRRTNRRSVRSSNRRTVRRSNRRTVRRSNRRSVRRSNRRTVKRSNRKRNNRRIKKQLYGGAYGGNNYKDLYALSSEEDESSSLGMSTTSSDAKRYIRRNPHIFYISSTRYRDEEEWDYPIIKFYKSEFNRLSRAFKPYDKIHTIDGKEVTISKHIYLTPVQKELGASKPGGFQTLDSFNDVWIGKYKKEYGDFLEELKNHIGWPPSKWPTDDENNGKVPESILKKYKNMFKKINKLANRILSREKLKSEMRKEDKITFYDKISEDKLIRELEATHKPIPIPNSREFKIEFPIFMGRIKRHAINEGNVDNLEPIEGLLEELITPPEEPPNAEAKAAVVKEGKQAWMSPISYETNSDLTDSDDDDDMDKEENELLEKWGEKRLPKSIKGAEDFGIKGPDVMPSNKEMITLNGDDFSPGDTKSLLNEKIIKQLTQSFAIQRKKDEEEARKLRNKLTDTESEVAATNEGVIKATAAAEAATAAASVATAAAEAMAKENVELRGKIEKIIKGMNSKPQMSIIKEDFEPTASDITNDFTNEGEYLGSQLRTKRDAANSRLKERIMRRGDTHNVASDFSNKLTRLGSLPRAPTELGKLNTRGFRGR